MHLRHYTQTNSRKITSDRLLKIGNVSEVNGWLDQTKIHIKLYDQTGSTKFEASELDWFDCVVITHNIYQENYQSSLHPYYITLIAPFRW